MKKEMAQAPVNVLTLGVKNDGSKDISAIVNRETAKYSLYFPAGTYKVSKPVHLKNPIFGAGYSRNSKVTNAHTWFLSEIQNDDFSAGVLNFSDGPSAINIENLNIRCCSKECAIRIVTEKYSPMTMIDKVGIYDVRSYGVFIKGRGSRPFFLQNMTIFSSREWPFPGVGIHLDGAVDNRFSNIEIMGCRISMEIAGGFNYGNNLHLWTGCMYGKDNGKWWRGTRGIVLTKSAAFNGSEIYPDTAFYALEARDENTSFHLKNIFYWEDGSTGGAPDFDGAFFGGKGFCTIDGGEIAVMGRGEKNGRMKQVRMAGQDVKSVVIRSDIPVSVRNIDKLCAGDELPDYSLEYREKGFCKAADIVLASKSGCTESVLTLGNGGAYRIRFVRSEDGGLETEILELNRLCRRKDIILKETSKNVYSVFVYNDSVLHLRFRTEIMGERFRPLHFGLLRNLNNGERNKLVLPKL